MTLLILSVPSSAKKQSTAVKSDSSIQEIEAAPGNTPNHVSDGKQRGDKKRRFPL
ncbi:hypothetical protein RYX36_023654 [Vicia faba]